MGIKDSRRVAELCVSACPAGAHSFFSRRGLKKSNRKFVSLHSWEVIRWASNLSTVICSNRPLSLIGWPTVQTSSKKWKSTLSVPPSVFDCFTFNPWPFACASAVLRPPTHLQPTAQRQRCCLQPGRKPAAGWCPPAVATHGDGSAAVWRRLCAHSAFWYFLHWWLCQTRKLSTLHWWVAYLLGVSVLVWQSLKVKFMLCKASASCQGMQDGNILLDFCQKILIAIIDWLIINKYLLKNYNQVKKKSIKNLW